MALAPASSSAASSGGGVTVISTTTFTSAVAIAGTSAGAPTTIVTAPSFTADGTTTYCVEFSSYLIDCIAAGTMIVELWEASAGIGRIAQYAFTAAAQSACTVRRYLVPAAGARVYSVRAWKTGGTYVVEAGAGTSNVGSPGYIRITSGG